MNLMGEFPELNYFDSGSLTCCLRSTVDAKVISSNSPQQMMHEVLRNTLEKPANWYLTMQSAIHGLSRDDRLVAVVGSEKSIPASLLSQSSPLRITSIANLLRSTPQPSRRLNVESDLENEQTAISDYPSHAIAVVGMAGRFPGADSVEELWNLLMEGKSMVEPAPAEKFGLSQSDRQSNTRWWGNFLNDRESFDHRFFGKSSREASSWDPQQRILLEVIYESLESAGYFGVSSEKEPKDYGCYIGAAMNNYYDNLSCHPATAYATVGTSRSFLSGSMSHHFGWTGPSLTIDTACSSSLVAINTACRAIVSGECSRAVAGGTNVISSPFDYQNLAAAGFLSPSGQCKPFDASADGYCRGEAVSVVVLKSLREAMADGDDVLGVIVGSAANQNDNSSQITAPNSESQVSLYQKVLMQSNVHPDDVTYVEAHGTGTGTGDPVEVRSIREAFGGDHRQRLLHFASIKGSIGHTEATAGVAGLVKVLLMMRHNVIPAQVSHATLNPKLPRFDQHQMVIPKGNLSWQGPNRLALVNSYGAAGSNAALMLREKPPSSLSSSLGVTVDNSTHPVHPILISAASSGSASKYGSRILKWIKTQRSHPSGGDLSQLAFHLADRANQTLSHRMVTTASNLEDLQHQLEKRGVESNILETKKPGPLILVCGGQENSWIGLSREVYDSCQVFREQLDSCNAVLLSMGSDSIFPHVFSKAPVESLTQLHCGLFSVQYSCAKAWAQCGLKVDAVIGHSFGQLTALCISGVLSLEDALKLVLGRASIMEKHWGSEAGSMVFLQAELGQVEDALRHVQEDKEDGYAEIACYNGPKSHVVVGSETSVDALISFLGASTRSKKLPVTNGFHSAFTDPILPYIEELAEGLDWKKPTTHIETCDKHQSWVSPNKDILVHHTRQPVYFQKAVERLHEKFGPATWLEVGTDSSFTNLVKGCLPSLDGHCLLAPRLGFEKANESLANVTAGLWRSSHTVQHWPYHRSQKRQYGALHLPPYQFKRASHWLGFTSRHVNEQSAPQSTGHDISNALLYLADKNYSRGGQAVFNINTESDRFQSLTKGHVMAGHAFAPASLYFEVASRASLILHGDDGAVKYVPSVESLHMNSPLRDDSLINVKMTMKPTGSSHPCWRFTITTSLKTTQDAEMVEVASGLVSLKTRGDAQTSRQFKRFQMLLGSRYDEITNHPDAEKMQGSHIYRAFRTTVSYGTIFHGVKEISCVGNEAVGRVRITPATIDPPGQRLCDTPMMDSFMQFAGLLINYFHNPTLEDLFLCNKIESIEMSGGFDPNVGEWVVHSTMDQDSGGNITCDAYVMDPVSRKVVVTALGFSFSKMSRGSLLRILESVPQTKPAGHVPTPFSTSKNIVSVPAETKTEVPYTEPSRNSQLLDIISEVTDLPLSDLKSKASLDSLGVDSLMATEILNDIRAKLGIIIGLSEFLFFPNLAAIEEHVNSQLGTKASTSIGSEGGNENSRLPDPIKTNPSVDTRRPTLKHEQPMASDSIGRSSILSPETAFDEIACTYDEVAGSTGALGFWSEAYPHQRRLVLAHVVQTFAELGCDLAKVKTGETIPTVRVLDKHAKLLRQLYRILEDGGLVSGVDAGFIRTETAVERSSAQEIYREISGLHPQHDGVNKLVHAVGRQLADCLTGAKDGLQVVFGNRDNKETLEKVYEFWPLLRAPTLLLGDFLVKIFTNSAGQGKFRILEIGAGTGGTTRYIVNRLRAYGIPFEYVFTDISTALVNAAKKAFLNDKDMSFEVLDIEQTPRPELLGAFDCIIATNCIHATRNLEASLHNVKQLLCKTGILTLIEITSNMYWLDLVVGLFEGWWLFEDDRHHALVDERQWGRVLKNAGFGHVAWTDGQSPESKTVRLISVFPQHKEHSGSAGPRAGFETVTYKRIGDQEILADIYYPLDGVSSRKMPIGKWPL